MGRSKLSCNTSFLAHLMFEKCIPNYLLTLLYTLACSGMFFWRKTSHVLYFWNSDPPVTFTITPPRPHPSPHKKNIWTHLPRLPVCLVCLNTRAIGKTWGHGPKRCRSFVMVQENTNALSASCVYSEFLSVCFYVCLRLTHFTTPLSAFLALCVTVIFCFITFWPQNAPQKKKS